MKFFVLSVLLIAGLAGNAVCNEGPSIEKGKFVTLHLGDDTAVRAFVAGPKDANTAVLVVHDYFGISDATQESVKHLASLGYLAMAIDLYGGKSARNHEDAVKLMRSLDPKVTQKILQRGIDHLKRPGRNLATVGFSMGGQEALNANLNDPDAVSATAVVYGFGLDNIDIKRLQTLKSPVLVITGAEDTDAVQTAIRFLSNMRDAERACEMFVYPGVDHGYAQPLFNGGKNYSAEAVRVTWVVIDDFLSSHLKR